MPADLALENRLPIVRQLERLAELGYTFKTGPELEFFLFRQDEDEEGRPVTRMRPRSLMVPPGIPEFPRRERTLAAGPYPAELADGGPVACAVAAGALRVKGPGADLRVPFPEIAGSNGESR